MKVMREELLRVLDSVFPGVHEREHIQQSSCFVFTEGKVYTFNDEVCCYAPSGLSPETTCAVRAKKFLTFLRGYKKDEVSLTLEEKKLVLKEGPRRATFAVELDVFLPIDQVEKPGDFRPLSEEFCEAVQMVKDCAGKDESQFETTCVHIAPKWVEAADGYQVMRYKIDTGLDEGFLVKRDAVKHIVSLGMCEISETERWVHFRNHSGMTMSCRRYASDYQDYKNALKLTGDKVALPKGIADATTLAAEFSSEQPDENLVTVRLSNGKVKIVGRGITGEYEESKKVNYSGGDLEFLITPQLLITLTQKYSEALLSADKLMVVGGKWRYATMLTSPEGEKYEVEEVSDELE